MKHLAWRPSGLGIAGAAAAQDLPAVAVQRGPRCCSISRTATATSPSRSRDRTASMPARRPSRVAQHRPAPARPPRRRLLPVSAQRDERREARGADAARRRPRQVGRRSAQGSHRERTLRGQGRGNRETRGRADRPERSAVRGRPMRVSSKLTSPHAVALALAAALIGGPAAADMVIPDDVIIQGSCASASTASTTSRSAPTPSSSRKTSSASCSSHQRGGLPEQRMAGDREMRDRDRQPVAIEDATAVRRLMTLEAGAPANSIFLDSSGRVGFRTSTRCSICMSRPATRRRIGSNRPTPAASPRRPGTSPATRPISSCAT